MVKKQRQTDNIQENLDFSPGLLDVVKQPPPPLSRWILYTIALLLFILILWAIFGQLDIVARAEGKLIPQTRLQIVQPFEGGRVAEIRVKEDEFVKQGQLLLVMDAHLSEADTKKLHSELQATRLQLRSIEAELDGEAFTRQEEENAGIFDKAYQQYQERRNKYQYQLNQKQAILRQAEQDLKAATEIYKKLKETLPIHQANEEAINRLGEKGYATRLAILEKQRIRIEAEQDLRAQKHVIESTRGKIEETQEGLNQLKSAYRQDLLTKQIALQQKVEQLQQDWLKQEYRNEQLELKAPQDGYVKDLATYTQGSIVPAGNVLLSVVPVNEPLQAEVFVSNHDIGFVRPGQSVKVKLLSYEFQKYGMIDATVESVSADVSNP
ncbi:MAG: HlyD family type I secretion periplasmic adaptor subunit, partial [Pseudomonadota bacterium]|nr:HlyD family type I secretion periplasmic adaptor subunit [Pseudomonadota bacterium]